MSCSVFCHVRNFTYLSVAKINKQNSDMTWRRHKLNLRNSLLLEEYFWVMKKFDSTLSSIIDSTLGLRCRSFGYQYSEIICSLMSIYIRGDSYIEDDRNGWMVCRIFGKENTHAVVSRLTTMILLQEKFSSSITFVEEIARFR